MTYYSEVPNSVKILNTFQGSEILYGLPKTHEKATFDVNKIENFLYDKKKEFCFSFKYDVEINKIKVKKQFFFCFYNQEQCNKWVNY